MRGREGIRVEWLGKLILELGVFAQTIRITDFLDIAIVAYIVYRLMLLVSKTSAANVAKAIILLVVVLWVSDVMQLKVINFVLGRALELGFLALVVIFQPELRRMLEQLGSSKLAAVFSSREPESSQLETAIDQTVAAYTALSKDKVGALMVFERKNMLDECIKTGTAMDSSVNAELLKNLFWNKAPLHDGAVIVRGGRIVGAGCMLPMSGNVNISKELGMRHRAGIGVSERSDAVVAIVSEETGAISVAVGGMLKRHLAPDTLERLLRNELMPLENEEEKSKTSLLSGFFKKKGEDEDGKERP